MNKTQLEAAAQWLERRAESHSDLVAAALRAAAFEMREEATCGVFFEPLTVDRNTTDFFRILQEAWSEGRPVFDTNR